MTNFNEILYPKIIYSSFLLNKATYNLDFIYEKILPNKLYPEVENFGYTFPSRQWPKSLVLQGIYRRKLFLWRLPRRKDSKHNLFGAWFLIPVTKINQFALRLKKLKNWHLEPKNNLFYSMLDPQHYFSPQNISSPLNYEVFLLNWNYWFKRY